MGGGVSTPGLLSFPPPNSGSTTPTSETGRDAASVMNTDTNASNKLKKLEHIVSKTFASAAHDVMATLI